MRLSTIGLVGVIGAMAVACGSDDGGEGSGNRGGSYESVANSIARPTGTLASDNAASVADEFSKVSAVNPGGSRLQPAADNSQKQACPAGGSMTISGSGSQSGGVEASFTYDGCCYTAGCCLEGGGKVYYAGQGSSAAEFTYCGNYDVEYTCGGSSASLDYSGCLGTSGEWVYVVEVNGKTFAVSGSYNYGSGTLEIKGANGSYTCTYNSGSGSCTGASGQFTF